MQQISSGGLYNAYSGIIKTVNGFKDVIGKTSESLKDVYKRQVDGVPGRNYTQADGDMLISGYKDGNGRYLEYTAEWIPQIAARTTAKINSAPKSCIKLSREPVSNTFVMSVSTFRLFLKH